MNRLSDRFRVMLFCSALWFGILGIRENSRPNENIAGLGRVQKSSCFGRLTQIIESFCTRRSDYVAAVSCGVKLLFLVNILCKHKVLPEP